MSIITSRNGRARKASGDRSAQAAAAPRDGVTVSAYIVRKAWLDRAAAVLLLVPGLPLLAILMLAVRCTSRGPAIYRQTRVGRGGESFTLFKIRTMCCDAEAESGAVWALKRDPRVTLLGRFIRRCHLDEIPQLFNVLKGEMSLIGPRPERPEFTTMLARQIPGYLHRLAVLPGVTGLAQINLPPDTDLASVRRKVEIDMHYIATADPWVDARIFICTIFRLSGVSSSTLVRMMRLKRTHRSSAYRETRTDSANRSTRGVAAATTVRQDAAAEAAKSNGALPPAASRKTTRTTPQD